MEDDSAEMALSYKDVAEILKIIDASQCEEVVIELQDLRLVVRRNHPRAPASATDAPVLADMALPGPSPHLTPAPPPGYSGRAKKSEPSIPEGHVAVRSPMVGSFYRRPSPDKAAFVEIGQRVKKGDPLCLIEVMKLYTTIPAADDGVLAAIFADDGVAVEFDQVLFLIKLDD
jgi:acetyl-CoA carboxylase biotin carboxyl carrier protein